jgi:L-seryl-tRNA(Ser) seleniumtransferase
MTADPRRRIPSVDSLLREPGVEALLRSAPRTVVVAAVREALAEARQAPGGLPANWIAEVEQRVARRTTPSLLSVINATGVVLHTNLGRAPLAGAALAAMHAAGAGYSNLEFDLASGRRGHRTDHCRSLLAELTGSEDALVVNNAAGALVLALNQVATGREVIISRGELIEIGGSFRIPEILEKSGAVLREVGTTNRTHLDDYARAIGPGTGAILTVHQSNFEQRGFVTAPAPKELAELADRHGFPYLYDIGSGLLADLSPFGLTSEPRVRDAVLSGAHAVLFSGDKLLGGPQAGCLVGRAELVSGCRRNAFARAFRADKLTLAALEATLRLYHDPEEARREIPVLAMLTARPAELAERAHRLAALLPAVVRPQVVGGESAVGGGAFPGAVLPTFLIALEPGSDGADMLAFRLRVGAPPVVARVGEGRVLLDPRTVPDVDLPRLADAVAAALTA